jgi:hypothetical protein
VTPITFSSFSAEGGQQELNEGRWHSLWKAQVRKGGEHGRLCFGWAD